jgi:hypothetical protein
MTMITVQLQDDAPFMQMDEADLVKSTGGIDNEVERTTWVEYRLKSDPNGRVVHRSVDVVLKKAAVFADGSVSPFGQGWRNEVN